MDQQSHRIALQRIARNAMIERGLTTDFPSAVLAELEKIQLPYNGLNGQIKDLRHLLWCSVDNAESLDLDQLSYAESMPDQKVKVMVAIADVDALVRKQSLIDQHASVNTVTVYTIAQIFPMLPEKLSTDLTSLRLDADREAVVVEMVTDQEGAVLQSDVYCALVRNRAKLVYETLAEWLEGKGPMPEEVARVNGLAETLQLQDQAAQKMKRLRYENGALEFETVEARPVFEGDTLREMKGQGKNRAQTMIEDFMIASNGVTARYLEKKQFPSLRRVVRTPKQWNRIVELASENGYALPEEADSKSLSQFLAFAKQTKPVQYADLSFSVLKLLGAGEYVVETPGTEGEGHFGLAVKDYAHSTAPNRRYPDLITHRLLKSAMAGATVPYSVEQLEIMARHCTLKEDDAKKVERQVEKSAIAMLLEYRIGEEFEAIVSGTSSKGTWIKVIRPHMEGKLVRGYQGLQVGHKLKVRLLSVNADLGFIDFESAG